MEKRIQGNKENLLKALELCAKAHNTNTTDYSEDEQIIVNGDSVPLISDVQMICDAFFGSHNHLEVNWGVCTIYLDEKPFLAYAEEMMLGFALPKGWLENF